MRARLHPVLLGAAALVTAGVFYTATPAVSQSSPRPANCEQTNSGPKCEEDEECMSILIYERCTTEIYRLPSSDDFGGGSSGGSGGDGLNNDLNEDGQCQWGDDYIGWEPSTC